jgi:methionyl-tRNA synthetase
LEYRETSELLPAGHQIGEAELLFKIEDEIQKQIDKLEATKTANSAENKKAEPQKEAIQFEDFAKMDIRQEPFLKQRKCQALILIQELMFVPYGI